MLQHFLVPVVRYTYAMLLAIVMIPYFERVPLGALMVAAMIADSLGHRQNHPENLGPPWATMTWIVIVLLGAEAAGVQMGWQAVGLLITQAIWDLSWHSYIYHRGPGMKPTPTDYWWVRAGAASVALIVMLSAQYS